MTGELQNPPKKERNFTETLVICDEQSWIWQAASKTLTACGVKHLRLNSKVSMRHNWQRLKNSDRIVINWENKGRGGGPVVEEILDTAPDLPIWDKIIIITTNPTHEDVVYFSELGLQRVVKMRNREGDINLAQAEFKNHILAKPIKSKRDATWQKIQKALQLSQGKNRPAQELEKILEIVNHLRFQIDKKPTSHFHDAIGCLSFINGEFVKAEESFLAALELNPNYFRSCNHLIELYKVRNEHEKSLALIRKMQTLNKNSVGRMVTLGQIYKNMQEDAKAEHYFNAALSKDRYCSAALNGLASIRFEQGLLTDSRKLLSQSKLAFEMASELNEQGIRLVRSKRYEDALAHYTKAQYVLPQQEKGPLLFYNMGLCYSKWGNNSMATQYLKIALIKSPEYTKAKQLLERINS